MKTTMKQTIKNNGGQVFTCYMFDHEYRVIKNSTHWKSWADVEQYKLTDGLVVQKMAAQIPIWRSAEVVIRIPDGKVIDWRLLDY
jgi:hypothetical protein